MENGMEDALRLSGVAYPDRTRMGEFKVSVELAIDWEDPANGFSSISEFRDWVSGAGTTNLPVPLGHRHERRHRRDARAHYRPPEAP